MKRAVYQGSEHILETELDHARIHRQRAGELPEGGRSNLQRLRIDGADSTRRSKLRMVPDVEKLEAQLHGLPFRDSSGLDQRHVPVEFARTENDAGPRVPEQRGAVGGIGSYGRSAV